MDNSIENQFNDKTFGIYEDAKNLCGYSAIRFLQKIKRDGGVKAAKSWLNPKDKDKPPTSGFLVLVENGRLDISLEALVLREPWRNLFTRDELDVANSRLKKYGYNLTELKNEKSEQLIPEEIYTPEVYLEGTKYSITVNAYERNPKAREKCLEYYGTSCVICNFNFEKFYGTNFKNFIHIHHLRPLATIAENYVLDPLNDLRPVCPNCHAIIHRKNPPYTIPEIKKLIKKKNLKTI